MDIIDMLKKRCAQWDSSISYLGQDHYRVILKWDGQCQDGRQLGAHMQDAILHITPDAICQTYLILSYIFEGQAMDPQMANQGPMDPFPLDSYVGWVCFDAAFG